MGESLLVRPIVSKFETFMYQTTETQWKNWSLPATTRRYSKIFLVFCCIASTQGSGTGQAIGFSFNNPGVRDYYFDYSLYTNGTVYTSGTQTYNCYSNTVELSNVPAGTVICINNNNGTTTGGYCMGKGMAILYCKA